MVYNSKKSDTVWIVTLIALISILTVQFLFTGLHSETPNGRSRVQWYLSDGQSESPVEFPCRIPTGSQETYQFTTEFAASPNKDMILALYRNRQALFVHVNGQLVYTSDDSSVLGNYELIPIGQLSGNVRLELTLHNQMPVMFGQMAHIDLVETNVVFQAIISRIAKEALLSILMFLTGFILLLLNKIYYKTTEESYSMKYIGWFMVLLAGWCLLRSHFFHLITGSSNLLYLIENLLLLLFPQFLVKASGILAYPSIFRREYQGFYLIYKVYFILAVSAVITKCYSLEYAAVWSILYLFIFLIYIGTFGFFEIRITSIFDKDRGILHSSLLKNLKTVIALFGCVLALNLTSYEIYYPLLIAAYIAVISFSIEISNQVKALSRLKEEFDQSQVSLLLSQIKPHFLYNTLNSIRTLIRIQPEAADQLVYNFSRFLRADMNALDEIMIPFNKELEHIQFYVNIEQTCFPKLKVDYQIESQDFSVPSLTIQPLVENAIKHGVLKRVEGGTVHIRTYEDPNAWYVEIDDDGVGFSPKQIQSQNRGIGLRNIERRLEYHCHASLYIHSALNQGTFIRVTVPKMKKGDHNED